jgi:hypothetical protein
VDLNQSGATAEIQLLWSRSVEFQPQVCRPFALPVMSGLQMEISEIGSDLSQFFDYGD